MSNLGRPRTRPPVRRVTVEIDAELLKRVEQQTVYDGIPLRTAVEEGLALLLQVLEEGHIKR